MKKRAISLLSGGLDSTLSTRLIMEQGIDVVALHFSSPFASRRDRERGLQAERTANELGVTLICRDKGEEYLEIVKNPRHGYGKNMNPCIDCRIYMLRATREVMEETAAGFVVTGEVLGQRPMSQMRQTIELIERESGLEDLIVRPLSAKLFPPSKPERDGIVDRSRLLDISGRSRKAQNLLAGKYELLEFGHPAGGCLLTDPIFSKKLRDIMVHEGDFSLRDIEYMNLGRYFRIDSATILILGRDMQENETIKARWALPYVMFNPVNFKGPTGLLKGNLTGANFEKTALIMASFSKNVSSPVMVEYNDGSVKTFVTKKKDINIECYKIEGVP